MKNSSIELMRFVLTCCVIIMHAGWLNGFYLAVDFFFILTGYLLSLSMKKHEGDYIAFLFHRMKRIYIHYWIALGLTIGFSIKYQGYLDEFGSEKITALVIEGLGVQILFPFSRFDFKLGVAWFVSAMIIGQIIILGLYETHRKVYLYFLAPLLIFVFLSMSIIEIGSLDATVNWYVFPGFSSYGFNIGLLRGVALMGLGVLTNELYDYICKKRRLNRMNILIYNLSEIIIFIFLFVYMIFNRGISTDLFVVLLMPLLILFSFLGEGGIIKRVFSNRFVLWGGKISYLMYLTQFFVIWESGIIFGRLGIAWEINSTTVVFIIAFSIILSSVIQVLSDIIESKIRRVNK